MDRWLVFVFIGLGSLVLFSFGWRLLSRRHLLPCPAGFIWMLENRIMESVAGTEVLIQRAQISPGMIVLDAGCGPGRVSVPLAEYLAPGGKVVAVDVQAGMLEVLRERIDQVGVGNLEMIHAGLGEGKLPISTFDRAIMVTVLGEIPNQTEALKEIYLALKPGGVLSITEVLPDPHYQRRRKVRALGQAVGFSTHEVFIGWRSYTLNLQRS